MLNAESGPSDISYKSFKTQDLLLQASSFDHRNFDSVNQPLIYCFRKPVGKYDYFRLLFHFFQIQLYLVPTKSVVHQLVPMD